MAEILIQARGHWMDNLSQAQIDALDEGQKDSRNARIQLGDIVVVKPDGWVWGAEENLPRYLVVKLPQLSVATVEHFTQSLMDLTDPENPKMKRKRKYQIPANYIQPYIDAETSSVTITLTNQQQNFINNVIEKSS